MGRRIDDHLIAVRNGSSRLIRLGGFGIGGIGRLGIHIPGDHIEGQLELVVGCGIAGVVGAPVGILCVPLHEGVTAHILDVVQAVTQVRQAPVVMDCTQIHAGILVCHADVLTTVGKGPGAVAVVDNGPDLTLAVAGQNALSQGNVHTHIVVAGLGCGQCLAVGRDVDHNLCAVAEGQTAHRLTGLGAGFSRLSAGLGRLCASVIQLVDTDILLARAIAGENRRTIVGIVAKQIPCKLALSSQGCHTGIADADQPGRVCRQFCFRPKIVLGGRSCIQIAFAGRKGKGIFYQSTVLQCQNLNIRCDSHGILRFGHSRCSTVVGLLVGRQGIILLCCYQNDLITCCQCGDIGDQRGSLLRCEHANRQHGNNHSQCQQQRKDSAFVCVLHCLTSFGIPPQRGVGSYFHLVS